MASLHYRLSKLDHYWVLWSEDVAVDSFSSKETALRSAQAYVSAAKERGDHASLTIAGAERARKTA